MKNNLEKESSNYPSETQDRQRSLTASLRSYEEHAAILRQQAGVAPMARLDPSVLIHRYKIKIVDLGRLKYLSVADLDLLHKIDPKEWSGMGIPLPDGTIAVALHPTMTPQRANVTLMEEVAHLYYGHEPSDLVQQESGLIKRVYNQEIEEQAYQTAAAALLPSKAVGQAVWRQVPVEDLAAQYGASVELVGMRIKLLGLWYLYQNRPTPLRRAS